MADDLTILDGTGVARVRRETERTSKLIPHQIIEDGDSATLGAIADAAVAAGAAGTASAKLRRLTTDVDAGNTLTGIVTETAPATDTASSGLNGRLQRIAQRLTSLIALLPSSIGQKAKAASLSVTLASDEDALPVSGTVTADTELPAAAALADAAANPTTPLVGACLMVWQGVNTWARLRAADTHKDLSAVAIGSITTVWTPASGKKVRVMGMTISVSAACSILIEDNAGGTTVWRTPKLLADTPYNLDFGQGYLLSAANNVLKFTSSAAANATGTIYGVEE